LLEATKCAKITDVLSREYPGQACSAARTLELIGERWTLLVIRDVFAGNRRFDQMQRSLGIARNVLAARLQRLVEEGILEKRLYSHNPARHEYFLTEKGLDLWPILIALIGYGDKHLAGSEGPPQLILHKECGGQVNDRRICERCGKQLEVREARAVPGPGARAEAPVAA
jgi:DNA-binding HxlR family transcriptional regulator